MADRLAPRPRQWSRPKSIIFAAVGLMTLYVLYHNERFLIQPENPIWRHYAASVDGSLALAVPQHQAILGGVRHRAIFERVVVEPTSAFRSRDLERRPGADIGGRRSS